MRGYGKTEAGRQLRLSYDRDADVLYISFGPPEEAISEETGDGMLIRRNHVTNDAVGVTILDFEKRFESEKASALLPVILDSVRAA